MNVDLVNIYHIYSFFHIYIYIYMITTVYSFYNIPGIIYVTCYAPPGNPGWFSSDEPRLGFASYRSIISDFDFGDNLIRSFHSTHLFHISFHLIHSVIHHFFPRQATPTPLPLHLAESPLCLTLPVATLSHPTSSHFSISFIQLIQPTHLPQLI